MNRDLTVTNDDRPWDVGLYDPGLTRQGYGNASVLDLPTLLATLVRWKWIILATVALGIVLATIYTLATTPMYRAWVMLQVNPPTVQIMNEDSTGTAAAELGTGEEVATQVGLLKSSSLADRVAQDLNLSNNTHFVSAKQDPAKRLQAASEKIRDGLTVVPPQEGQVIQFSFASDSPDLAAEIANGLADAFINSTLQRRYESSAYARNFLQRQIAKIRTDLEKSERELVAYAQAEGIINTGSGDGNHDASDTSSPQGESLLEINKALAAATANRVAAEAAYKAASTNGITSTESASSQALRQSRAALEAQYQDKRNIMKPDHPDMVSLRSQISELDRQIARENKSVATARVNTLRVDYEASAAAERGLQSRLASLKHQVLDLRGRSIRYAILQRDVDTNRALYDALLQRYKEIGVAGGVGASPVSIVDRAEVPASPYKPNAFLNLGLGAALGLILGVLAAIASEFVSDTIQTRSDVRNKLGLASLGVIPRRSGKGTFVDDLNDPSSPVSDAYSSVAASLRFSTESGDPRTLLVTSARPAEGKSSSALALAQNFARRGKSVLLIDCDLRKPAFKSPSEQSGLTRLLTSSDALASHIHPTHFENLFLLASGPTPPNPADLLASARFSTLIREATMQFDMVVVDAPPVMGMADATLIASIVGNVMMVIESGKTRTALAREVVTKLQATGAHILGATLTKSAEERNAYGYNYPYGYGYSHQDLASDTKIALTEQ